MSKQSMNAVWIQPQPGDPSRYILYGNAQWKKKREEGNDVPPDPTVLMKGWHTLTLDEQKAYESGRRHDQYQAAICDFNANIPLSPSVSGESSSDSEFEDGGVRDRRAVQQWNRYRRDHRDRAGRAGDVTFSPFSELPFDIRRMIYVLHVKQARPVVQMESDGSGKHPSGAIDLRLALASKKLFDEVCKTFFEENIIQLDIMPGAAIGFPVLFNPQAKSAAIWPFEAIKRVHIFVEYGQKEHHNFVRAEFSKLVNVLQNCSLVLLQITACCTKKWFHEGLNESFDQALAALETVKSQELCFTEDLDTSWKRGLNSHEFRCVGTEEYKKHLQEIVRVI